MLDEITGRLIRDLVRVNAFDSCCKKGFSSWFLAGARKPLAMSLIFPLRHESGTVTGGDSAEFGLLPEAKRELASQMSRFSMCTSGCGRHGRQM
jgi:hypothetical protein